MKSGKVKLNNEYKHVKQILKNEATKDGTNARWRQQDYEKLFKVIPYSNGDLNEVSKSMGRSQADIKKGLWKLSD